MLTEKQYSMQLLHFSDHSSNLHKILMFKAFQQLFYWQAWVQILNWVPTPTGHTDKEDKLKIFTITHSIYSLYFIVHAKTYLKYALW